MIEFSRTSDLDLVRGVLTHPRVWPHVGDDFSGPVESFQPNDDPRLWYVQVMEDGRLVGLFVFVPKSQVLWEVHLSFLPVRRSRGTDILRGGLYWMFQHSTARRIRAEVPLSNKLATRLANQCMTWLGTDFDAVERGGALEPLALFGASKGDLCPA